jgi:hypothetical protein
MDSKDDFNDMKLVDQFIPLEQLEYSLFSFNYSLNTNEQNQLVSLVEIIKKMLFKFVYPLLVT